MDDTIRQAIHDFREYLQRRQYAHLTVQRDNIAVTDRRESDQAEVQQFALTVGHQRGVVQETAGIDGIDGTVEGKPLHSKQ